MPEREDDSLTSATRLLEKRREMSEVEQALTAQKEEFQMKMESLQQRREELERKELQLKESLLKFDKFLKDNDSKRVRAIKKASTERDIRRSKDREISKLNAEYSALLLQRDALLRRLRYNAAPHRYLDRVLQVAEEFHELREIIARHDTLVSTRQDLLESSQVSQDRVDDTRKELMHYTEEKHNEMLNCNNRLGKMQTRLDRAQGEAVRWESKWTHIQNTAARKTLLLGRIKMAVHNLHQVVAKHHVTTDDESSDDIDDTCQQLVKVKDYLEDLSEITLDIRRQDTQLTTSGFASSA